MAKLTINRFTNNEERQRYYIDVVDQLAEQARQTITTKGSGQAMTYEAKYLEAVKGDGPFLRAEAQALGMTVADVAGSVIEARQRWETTGAAIEAARLKAKREIKHASSALEMSRIVTGFTFPGNS